MVFAVFGVSGAHLHGVCERDVYVEPRSEIHRPGLEARLNKTMIGTQDASNGWKKLWREHLRSSGFELVASNPALYRPELQEKFDTRRICMTGAAEYLEKELEVLHRSVRAINNELMEIEADQKHIPQLLEDLGLTQSNIVKTPRVKLSVIEAEPIENSPILEGAQATTLRSGTMRCAYLAQDRVDSSEAIKCLAQAMSKLTGHMTQLQRVARYLKGVPRKALQQPSQEPIRAHLEVHVDSDWAGDTASRRSRSGVIVRRGLHLLRHSSTVQSVIGLSIAESEYYALTKGLFRIGSSKLVCRPEPEATTLIAYGVFEREGSCFAKRSWQEHSSYADEDAMASGTCSSETLASCESGNGIKSCRHLDAKIGHHARTVDENIMEVKKLKKVEFAVEAMETSDATITNRMMRLQRSRTSRRTQNCDGCVLWIEFSTMVESGQWTR